MFQIVIFLPYLCSRQTNQTGQMITKDWVMRETENEHNILIFFIMNNIFSNSENSNVTKTSFLARQIVAKPRTTAEAFKILTDAINANKAVQLIVSPRVDVANKAYFYTGVRFDVQEIDMKLPVSREMQDYVLQYMSGAENLPEVNNFEAETVEPENQAEWFLSLEKKVMNLNGIRREQVEITDGANYLKVNYKMEKGKISISKGTVDNLLQLLSLN